MLIFDISSYFMYNIESFGTCIKLFWDYNFETNLSHPEDKINDVNTIM